VGFEFYWAQSLLGWRWICFEYRRGEADMTMFQRVGRMPVPKLWRLPPSVALVLLLLFSGSVASSYSVLTHEAIIDSVWDSSIKGLLIQRFPDASADELTKAHAYAYGGSIVQDMGYCP